MLLLEQSRKCYGKTLLIRISEVEDGSKRPQKKTSWNTHKWEI